MLRAVLAALIVIASPSAESESTSTHPQIIPAPNDALMTPDQRAIQAYEAYRFAAAHRGNQESNVATVTARCRSKSQHGHAD
jgi:hypothetical protein